MFQYYDDSALDLDFSPDGQFFVYGRGGGDVVLARSGLLTGVEDPIAPEAETALAAPTPNPFQSETVLRFALRRPGNVHLEMYDVSGRIVATLVSGVRSEGEHAVRWDGRADGGTRVASGIYFARLATPDQVSTRKIVVLD
jgi:hypothetical protein